MQFRSLPGLTSYEEARRLQLELLERRGRGEIEDTVLFLEHEPVITRGRGLQFTGEARPRHMPVPALPPSVAFAESERGGDLTYHGPGQLVIYPIFKLDGSHGFAPRHDVAGFLRTFERVLIDELATLGVGATARESATGVWVGERKLASIGIAVRKWVTWHGMAINVVNDLTPFHLISPCGFSPDVMVRLADLAAVPGDWRAWLEARLQARFAAKVTEVADGCSVAAAQL
jgi:lipoyl(octanoyl) transferase